MKTIEKSELKEMQYTGNGVTEILYYESYDDGTALMVKNIRGSHPTAYITFPDISKVKYEEDLYFPGDVYPDIHGGFTFLGKLKEDTHDRIWIGWDYAHAGDWTQSVPVNEDIFDHHEERKYWEYEIIRECKIALQCIRDGSYIIDHDDYDNEYDNSTED